MDAQSLQSEAHVLRAELKQWEAAFAAAHSGRKAGREDIKQNPSIGTPPSSPLLADTPI